MNYGKNYLNASNLAEEIRMGASQGKVTKVAGGLAGREETRKELTTKPDFEVVRANYMNDIVDMFSSLGSKKEELAQKEDPMGLSFGLDSVDLNSTNPSDYGTTGRDYQGTDFLSKLIQAESSGNRSASYTTSGGETYAGLVQLGKARIADYNKATGSDVTQADLVQNPRVEDEVIKWHIQDLTTLATQLAEKTGMDVEGLVSVGHLGGRTGMTKFATGNYNPKDELGTSLQSYYNRFKNT
jgi:hypothetical protein